MAEVHDFEQTWLAKLSRGLDEFAGADVRHRVMQGSGRLSSRSSRREVIAWSRQALERLEALVDEKRCLAILTGCACQYPRSDLQPIREAYQASRDVDLAHRMLQAQFEAFLKDVLHLEEPLIEEIVQRGWGSAGVKRGDTIIATKIPKSGHLVEYVQESDAHKRRQLYCHCPRVRDVLRTSETLSPIYCYCGAGFYKTIWEEILQEPVQVEVLQSVLAGDDVCTIAVHLPPDSPSEEVRG